VLDRYAFEQQVQVQCAAPLELDLYEPLDVWPALSCGSSQLFKVAAALIPRQVLSCG